jgi:hypothetical protein
MLQAPTNDRKTKADASAKTAEQLPEQEQSSQLLGGMGQSRQSQPLQQRNNLTALQKVYGNQAVLRMKGRSPTANPVQGGVLQRKCACGNSAESSGSCAECQSKQEGILQTKLQIGEAGDRYEQEADRVAEQVMRMPDRPSSNHGLSFSSVDASTAQRKYTAYEEEKLQRKESGSTVDTPATVPPVVHEVLRSPGQPLDPATRAFMEPRFGHDFSQVRVHTGAAAELSAQKVNAHAYTVDHNIVFGAGRFAPGTSEGVRLLAHELAHVVQSSSSTSAINRQTIHRQPADGSPGDLALIDAEIQMLSEIPVTGGPEMAYIMMQLAQLLKRREELLRKGTGTYALAPAKPKAATTKPSTRAATGNANDDFSLDDMTQLQLDEMDRKLLDFKDMAKGRLGNKPFQTFQTSQTPQALQTTQSGCHVDPSVRSTGGTICGGGHHKQTDETTRRRQKAMQMPEPDLSAENAKHRAMLDRLNSAHLAWKQAGSFVRSTEFSPYEIQKDQIIPLYTRWSLFEKSDPEKDGIKNPVEYYFRSGNEYIQEKERRITTRPFKHRLSLARMTAQSLSNYSAHEAYERMTGEDVWRVGTFDDLFTESEKALVYKEQASMQQLQREKREERQAQGRHNFESQKQNNWEAQGKQLSSPTTIIQPIVMAAVGGPIAAIYTGMQTGMMGTEAYHACKDGFSGDCAKSLAPIAAIAVIHQVTKPAAPANPSMPKLATAAPTVIEPIVKPSIAEPAPATPPRTASITPAPKVTPSAAVKPVPAPTTAPTVTPTPKPGPFSGSRRVGPLGKFISALKIALADLIPEAQNIAGGSLPGLAAPAAKVPTGPALVEPTSPISPVAPTATRSTVVTPSTPAPQTPTQALPPSGAQSIQAPVSAPTAPTAFVAPTATRSTVVTPSTPAPQTPTQALPPSGAQSIPAPVSAPTAPTSSGIVLGSQAINQLPAPNVPTVTPAAPTAPAPSTVTPSQATPTVTPAAPTASKEAIQSEIIALTIQHNKIVKAGNPSPSWLSNQLKLLKKELGTLNRLVRGIPETLEKRWRLFEDFVEGEMRKQFSKVAVQPKIKVTLKNGNKVIIEPDTLVEISPGLYRIKDAKWTDAGDLVKASQASMTPGQRSAYPAIGRGEITEATLVDAKGAKQLGLRSDTIIKLDSTVEIITNETSLSDWTRSGLPNGQFSTRTLSSWE